jgi:predicted RNA-binding protein
MIGILGDVRSFKGRIIEIDTTRDEAVLEPKTEEEILM